MCKRYKNAYYEEFDYEKNLVQYIQGQTGIPQELIQDVLDCYKLCVEEELDTEVSVYLENLRLLTGYKYETIQTIMQTMTSYEEMIL